MGVAFDLNSDPRFEDSLEAFDKERSDGIVLTLMGIQFTGLDWAAFEHQYGWERLVIEGQDTYPGAMELYGFVIQLPSGEHIEVVAHKYDDLLVVCSVARTAN